MAEHDKQLLFIGKPDAKIATKVIMHLDRPLLIGGMQSKRKIIMRQQQRRISHMKGVWNC